MTIIRIVYEEYMYTCLCSFQLEAALGAADEDDDPSEGNESEVDEINSSYDDVWTRYGVSPSERGPDGPNPPITVVLATMFDLITKHKWTMTSASDIWTVLKAFLPGGSQLGSFNICKKILQAHLDQTLRAVDCCVNDCVLFCDLKHPRFSDDRYRFLQNSHRTRCPRCNEPRWYGNKQPRKTVYYFPCSKYFQGDISLSLSFSIFLVIID